MSNKKKKRNSVVFANISYICKPFIKGKSMCFIVSKYCNLHEISTSSAFVETNRHG